MASEYNQYNIDIFDIWVFLNNLALEKLIFSIFQIQPSTLLNLSYHHFRVLNVLYGSAVEFRCHNKTVDNLFEVSREEYEQ